MIKLWIHFAKKGLYQQLVCCDIKIPTRWRIWQTFWSYCIQVADWLLWCGWGLSYAPGLSYIVMYIAEILVISMCCWYVMATYALGESPADFSIHQNRCLWMQPILNLWQMQFASDKRWNVGRTKENLVFTMSNWKVQIEEVTVHVQSL